MQRQSVHTFEPTKLTIRANEWVYKKYIYIFNSKYRRKKFIYTKKRQKLSPDALKLCNHLMCKFKASTLLYPSKWQWGQTNEPKKYVFFDHFKIYIYIFNSKYNNETQKISTFLRFNTVIVRNRFSFQIVSWARCLSV